MPQKRPVIKHLPGRNCNVLFGVLLFLWLPFLNLYAQKDTTKNLNPVSVFAKSDSVARIAVMTSSVPHFILNEEKLAGLAVTDIGSAMKFVPGAQLKDYGGIGGIKTVSFRSLGAVHTGVILDGIRVPNVQSGAINLSFFEIFGVNELSFTSGQTEENNVSASAYLQPNTIAVKSQLATRPEKMKLRVYSNASSISSFDEGILFQVPVSKHVFFGVQAMTKFGKGNYLYSYEPSGITEVQRRSNSELFNYKIRSVVGLDFKNSHTLFSATYFNNEQELPGALILYNASNDQKLWNEDYRFSVLHDQKIGRWRMSINAFYQAAFMRYYDPDFLNLQGFLDNSYLQQNIGGGAIFKRPLLKEKAFLFFGSDVLYSKLTGSNVTALPNRIENNSVVGFSGFFGPVKIESNVTFQAIRDQFNFKDSLNTRYFTEPSPFVSIAWSPFKSGNLRIRSFYKRAFTMPTFNDLYYNFIGNSMLKPEKAHLFNLGITYVKKIGKWTGEFSLDGFYNRIQNKIIAVPTKDLFNWSMQNIGEIVAIGYDAGFLIAYQKKAWTFTFNGSYTYNLSLDISDQQSSTYGEQIPYTPFHSGTAGIAASFEDFRLNVQALYTGFRYTLNENIYANYLAPFTDISASFSKGFRMTKYFQLNVAVSVMNILNKNYEVIRSFPMPGRYYQLTLNLNLR